jgi:Fic family protein
MSELTSWVDNERKRGHWHPLLIIAIFVVVFLEIHPFQDGNGRLSRALTTLLLIQAGYAYVPYSSLESVIELNKEAYYLALRQTQGTIRTETPDWQPWLEFFCARWQNKSDVWRRRSSAKESCWPRCPNCRCRSWSLPGSTDESR